MICPLQTVLRSSAIVAMAVFPCGGAPAQQIAPAGSWQVDWGEQRCSLIRHSGPDQPLLVVRTVPGSRLWELMFVRRDLPAALRRDRSDVSVRLRPSGYEVDGGGVSILETGSGPALRMFGLRREFVDRFAEARSVSLRSGSSDLFDIRIPGASEAIAALSQCEDEGMRDWGIDPVAFRAVAQPPFVNPGSYIRDADYPQEALARSLSGMTVVRLIIDPAGRVSDCAIVASSGHVVLDSATCRILKDRVRTTPALDSSGTAISTPLVTSVSWRISG